AAIGIGGIVAGAIGGVLLSRIVGSFVPDVQMPGLAPIAGAAFVLIAAAIVASLTHAARASRVDVICALRSESSPNRSSQRRAVQRDGLYRLSGDRPSLLVVDANGHQVVGMTLVVDPKGWNGPTPHHGIRAKS